MPGTYVDFLGSYCIAVVNQRSSGESFSREVRAPPASFQGQSSSCCTIFATLRTKRRSRNGDFDKTSSVPRGAFRLLAFARRCTPPSHSRRSGVPWRFPSVVGRRPPITTAHHVDLRAASMLDGRFICDRNERNGGDRGYMRTRPPDSA